MNTFRNLNTLVMHRNFKELLKEQKSVCITDKLFTVIIKQIGCRFPMFKYIFQPSKAGTLTVKMISNLLKPTFSCVGSNERMYENAVYAVFMKHSVAVACRFVYSHECRLCQINHQAINCTDKPDGESREDSAHR